MSYSRLKTDAFSPSFCKKSYIARKTFLVEANSLKKQKTIEGIVFDMHGVLVFAFPLKKYSRKVHKIFNLNCEKSPHFRAGMKGLICPMQHRIVWLQ